MRGQVVLAILLYGALHTGWCVAAEPENMPSIELPASLKVYSDVDKVIDAADSAIRLLATAKFDELRPDEYDFAITKTLAKPPCNIPEISSFYRGMTLVKGAYYVFINKMERGFESLDSPHLSGLPDGAAAPPATFGALIKSGRELLVGAWDQDKLKRLLSLTSAARRLPSDVRADLTTYFGMLREFALRYDALKRRAPSDLATLNRRATWLYDYERKSALEGAKSIDEGALGRAQARYPEPVGGKGYSKAMRLLLNANRDVGQKHVSECFDGGGFAQLRLGSNAELAFGYDPPSLFPTSYMVGFWQRRDFEGTSALTRFGIDHLLTELKQ